MNRLELVPTVVTRDDTSGPDDAEAARSAGSDGDSDTARSKGSDEDSELRSRVSQLHEHLAATAELPIDPKTNRWLGEAEAVAQDAASPGLDPGTRRKRVRQVERLLSAAEDPENEDAAAHLEAARGACRELLSDDH